MTLFLFTLISDGFIITTHLMNIAKDSSILAHRIRAIRNSKGWTQIRLAEEINVHPTYISRIESCKKLPTFYIISRIAEALEVAIYELLIDDEKIESSDYKRKKIINIVRESSTANINIYFPLINALHKEHKRSKKKK